MKDLKAMDTATLPEDGDLVLIAHRLSRGSEDYFIYEMGYFVDGEVEVLPEGTALWDSVDHWYLLPVDEGIEE